MRALELREASLGPADINTAFSMSNVAGVFCDKGRLEEAAGLYRAALNIVEAIRGPGERLVSPAKVVISPPSCPPPPPPPADHPDTGINLSGLALVIQAQGELVEAAEMHRRVLKLFQAALGPDHADCGQYLSNLASVSESSRTVRDRMVRTVSTRGGGGEVAPIHLQQASDLPSPSPKGAASHGRAR